MTNVKKYLDLIKKILEAKFGVDPKDVTPESYFEDDLNLSQLELNELLDELAEKLQVELMEDKEEIASVEDLLEILAEKLE